jgi:putative sporulation protein YtxC
VGILNRYVIGTTKLFDQLVFYLEKGLQETLPLDVMMTTGRCLRGGRWYYTIEWKKTEDGHRVPIVLAKSLAEFLAMEWEKERIRRRIAKEYTYYDADEVDYLAENSVAILSRYKRPGSHTSRKIELEFEIRKYMQQHSVLNVEGLTRFWLRRLEPDLGYAIEKAIDEYLMDREYQEFVKLLRHFLHLQTSRSSLIHLILGPHARLIDQDGLEFLEENSNDDRDDLNETDLQEDDMIISTLITLAPVRLKIHFAGKNQDEQVLLDTIKRVFEERVTFCERCEICQSAAEFLDPRDHFPLDYSK